MQYLFGNGKTEYFFWNKSIGSQILKRPQYPYISVCVKEKNNVFKTHIYNSVFLSSSRNGWKGLHSTYWIERGFDGFSGCELDFNTDLKTQRQKSKHVYDDKPK